MIEGQQLLMRKNHFLVKIKREKQEEVFKEKRIQNRISISNQVSSELNNLFDEIQLTIHSGKNNIQPIQKLNEMVSSQQELCILAVQNHITQLIIKQLNYQNQIENNFQDQHEWQWLQGLMTFMQQIFQLPGEYIQHIVDECEMGIRLLEMLVEVSNAFFNSYPSELKSYNLCVNSNQLEDRLNLLILQLENLISYIVIDNERQRQIVWKDKRLFYVIIAQHQSKQIDQLRVALMFFVRVLVKNMELMEQQNYLDYVLIQLMQMYHLEEKQYDLDELQQRLHIMLEIVRYGANKGQKSQIVSYFNYKFGRSSVFLR